MKVGVLDLQGDVIEHRVALESCGATVVSVKTPEDLEKVEALVMPGGESTTISKLMHWSGLWEAVEERAKAGMPIYGTCAGAILLADMGLMDLEVERNAYGRQLDSFETSFDVRLGEKEKKVKAIFIRAPRFRRIGKKVDSLAEYDGEAVLVRQGNFLASTFHPELTGDFSIHRYFLTFTRDAK